MSRSPCSRLIPCGGIDPEMLRGYCQTCGWSALVGPLKSATLGQKSGYGRCEKEMTSVKCGDPPGDQT